MIKTVTKQKLTSTGGPLLSGYDCYMMHNTGRLLVTSKAII